MNILKSTLILSCGLMTAHIVFEVADYDGSSWFSAVSLYSQANANEDGAGGHKSGGHKGGGHGGSHSDHDHQFGKGEKGGHDEPDDTSHAPGHGGRENIEDRVFRGGGHSDQGGHTNDVETRTDRSSGNRGGRPPWAREGIPEVELGRLNVARSPDHVLNRALSEVLKNTNEGLVPIDTAWYSMSAEEAASYLQTHPELIKIDSPLENLALFKTLIDDGQTRLTGVTPRTTTDLAAIFLGSAADKRLEVTTDTVKAVAIILGITIENESVLAEKADTVRRAIEEVHDR